MVSRSGLCAIGVVFISVAGAGCGSGSHVMPLTGGQAAQHVALARSFTSNTWSTGAPDPLKRDGSAAAAVGTDIYVLGGADSAGQIGKNDIYHVTTNSWTTGASMPTKRCCAAAAAVNGIVYVIGGYDNTNNATAVVEAYDPAHNSWTTKAPLPAAEYQISATVLNGLIYVIGGISGSTRLASVYAYDPTTNAWSTAPSLIVAKQSVYAGTVGADIFAAGGFTNAGKSTTDNEILKSGNTAWKNRHGMPSARFAGCAAGINGFLYAAGGAKSASSTASALNVLDGYDAATDKWVSLAPMPFAALYTASATVNGLLYCFDGTHTNRLPRQFLNYTQIYTP